MSAFVTQAGPVLVAFVFWLVVAALVGNDAARHGRSWFKWAAVVWFTSLVGLVIWFVVRRRSAKTDDPRPPRLVARVGALVLLAVISIVVDSWTIAFLVQSARMDGVSMSPTVADGDRLIVNKLVYRWRDPQRNDIVMMRYPLDPQKLFLKRVIALEGDVVRIVNGQVYVNDVPLPDPYVLDEFRSHDDWGPQMIAEGYDFVLGDRRNNSSDSRHWGLVPKRYILGRVALRWWPFYGLRVF